jgi:hypothetical protein
MNEFNRKILVIGYGEMGHAMEFLLAGPGDLSTMATCAGSHHHEPGRLLLQAGKSEHNEP